MLRWIVNFVVASTLSVVQNRAVGHITVVEFYACYVCWLLPALVAANRHNTHAIHQLLFVQRLLKMSK
jgi:hypothetical protein